tara:strand:+ start:617 stop:2101 length:1485 start_codon:yes stop_codon:yes gene_type:complete
MKKVVKYFNHLVKKTIFKVRNKTNSNFKISNFNKYVITFISLLFFYLFYLSIPTLYDKVWIQNNIDNKLYKEFNIKFSTSSDISYNILPSPHFLIKDSKLFKEEEEKKILLSEIKNLKVFISQKNLFKKEKIEINEVIIDSANFYLLRKDFELLNNSSNNKFSDKKIKVNNSNIFFKDNSNETVAIIKVSKAFLFFDNPKLLNLFNLKGTLFKVPFTFDLNKKFQPSGNKSININAKKLKLNIFNESSNKIKNLINGSNIITFLNSKIYTQYNVNKNLINFKSGNSKIKNSKIYYKGQLSINPFDLKIDVNLEDYVISELFNPNSIFVELIKTGLLFNENISVNSSITVNSNKKEKVFDSAKINIKILNGKLNFNQTKIINKKIGEFKLDNSNLFFENDQLILNTDIVINILNPDNLFSFLQTERKSRTPFKNIFINLDYDFSTNQIKFYKFNIDGSEASDKMQRIIKNFDVNNANNLNKSRRLLNKLFTAYEG